MQHHYKLNKPYLSSEIGLFLKTFAEPASMSRGQLYYKGGHVHNFASSGSQMSAQVDGSERYDVYFTISAHGKQLISNNHCTCPYSGDGICKHQVATLLWLKNNLDFVDFFAIELADTNIKPEQKEPAKKRLSSDLFVIENFNPNNKLPFVQQFASQQTNANYKLHDYTIEELGENTFSIVVQFTATNYWNEHIENQQLQLQITQNSIAISCTCKQKVKTICGHVYALVQNFIENETFKQLAPLTNQQKEENGKYALQQYGLPANDNWEKYFKIDFKKGARVLVPIGEYANLLSIQQLHPDLAKLVFKADAEATLKHKNKKIESNPYNVGFVFAFSWKEGGIRLDAIAGKKGRNNLPLETNFKMFDDVQGRYAINYLPGTKDLINLAEAMVEHHYEEDDLQQDIEQLQQERHTLAAYPYVYYSKSFRAYEYKKNLIEPITFIPNAPEITYVLHEKEGFMHFSFSIKHGNEQIPVHRKIINRVHPYFVLVEQSLYFIPTMPEMNHFNVIFELHNKQITLASFPRFF